MISVSTQKSSLNCCSPLGHFHCESFSVCHNTFITFICIWLWDGPHYCTTCTHSYIPCIWVLFFSRPPFIRQTSAALFSLMFVFSSCLVYIPSTGVDVKKGASVNGGLITHWQGGFVPPETLTLLSSLFLAKKNKNGEVKTMPGCEWTGRLIWKKGAGLKSVNF